MQFKSNEGHGNLYISTVTYVVKLQEQCNFKTRIAYVKSTKATSYLKQIIIHHNLKTRLQCTGSSELLVSILCHKHDAMRAAA